MADFAKLAEQIAAQRAAKAEAIEQPKQEPAPRTRRSPAAAAAAAAPAEIEQAEQPVARRGRKPSASSKRQGWIARTYYLRPETAERLRRYVLQQQLEGGAAVDGSEVVDAALSAWLDQQEKRRA